MWYTLLTLLLLVLATITYAANPPHNVSEGVDRGTSTHDETGSPDVKRLALNGYFLENLDKRLEAIREKLGKASQVDLERTYQEIQARVRHLEGSSCDENQFECGRRSAQCISDLFVCDGHKDCTNGYDEDESVCSIDPALAGRTYSGFVHWTSCETRADNPVNITILAYRIRKYSSSIVWLKGLVEATFQSDTGKQVHMSHTAIGHYKFAKRRMVLIGEGIGKQNAAYCKFDRGDNERAKCDLVKISTLAVCATINLKLAE